MLMVFDGIEQTSSGIAGVALLLRQFGAVPASQFLDTFSPTTEALLTGAVLPYLLPGPFVHSVLGVQHTVDQGSTTDAAFSTPFRQCVYHRTVSPGQVVPMKTSRWRIYITCSIEQDMGTHLGPIPPLMADEPTICTSCHGTARCSHA